MEISLVLQESIYDCKIKISDARGERYHYISAMREEETSSSSILVDIFDGDFSLSLIPVMTDTKTLINEIEETDWKDKLAKKALTFLSSSLDKMILRIGCDYHISGLQDGDCLDIRMQNYAFGAFDRFDLLELVPVCYAFFEVSNSNSRYNLTNAYETNRKDVLRSAKALALSDILGNGLILTIFTYPIQVGRAKRLTKNKKIRKVLTKFNTLSDTERQRFLKKQASFFNR